MTKQIAKTATTWLRTLCLLALFLPGCNASNVYRHEVLPQSYQVLEFNSPKVLRLVIADWLVPGSRDVAEAAVLTERAPDWGENLQALIASAPASHVLGGGNMWADLGTVTDAMSDAAPDNNRGDNTIPIFWIISIDPPVVAEGIGRIDTAKLNFYDGKYLAVCRLARKQELAAKATFIYVLDQFPPNPGGLQGDEANQWKKAIVAKTRRVQLPAPMTLGDIMNNPDLWRSSKTDHE